MSEPGSEYEEAYFIGQEIIWGKGYMSPGGDDEVAAIIDGVDVQDKIILEIGSGLGGPAIALTEHHKARLVVGIDIQREQIDWATKLAENRGVANLVKFQLVEPGPLPFEDASFDMVFSMGSILQIPDKRNLFIEARRVLRPGGIFVGNDRLRRWAGPLSDELVEHEDISGLTYHWASPADYNDLLSEAGFEDVAINERDAWMVDQLRNDLTALRSGAIHDEIVEMFGESADSWFDTVKRLLVMAERGELIVAHFRASK